MFGLHLFKKISTSSFKKIELINFPNICFSIFYLYLLHIIKFPFNILTFLSFYFQTFHFLLFLSKPSLNLIQTFSWIFIFITP